MKNIGTKSYVLSIISVIIQEVPSLCINRKVKYLQVGFL
jgi:hypothetical protein